jgi:hypothetical protein
MNRRRRVNLGVDAKKSDQVVRGSVVLPSGTGKSVRVAVFAQGAKAEAAQGRRRRHRRHGRPRRQVKGGNDELRRRASRRRMPCASSVRWVRSSARAA